MLKKLIKYDLKYNYKPLVIFYGLLLILSILTRLTTSTNPPLALLVINKILSGSVISIVASIIINNLMRAWARFKINIYGDESYLTHTLPVTKREIYLSKLISTIITLLTSMLIIVLCLFIACYSKELLDYIKHSLTSMAGIYNTSIPILIITFFLVITVELLTLLVSGFSGLLLGHRHNNNKIFLSIFYGFITYIVCQLFVLGTVYLIGLTNDGIMQIFKTNQILDVNVLKQLLSIIIITYIVVIIILNFINIKIFKKGVNVE